MVTPACRAASRTVWPSRACTTRPSIVTAGMALAPGSPEGPRPRRTLPEAAGGAGSVLGAQVQAEGVLDQDVLPPLVQAHPLDPPDHLLARHVAGAGGARLGAERVEAAEQLAVLLGEAPDHPG